MQKHANYPVNEQIKVQRLIVIDEEGKNLGELDKEQALREAQERDIDLVLVAPKANPPVAKLIDKGKFRYEQEKQLQKQKAKQKKIEIKGIRLSFKIGEHDRTLKLKQAAKFLESGHKVKLEMLLRGRERQFAEQAVENVKKFINDLGENVSPEQGVSMQGAKLTVLVAQKR